MYLFNTKTFSSIPPPTPPTPGPHPPSGTGKEGRRKPGTRSGTWCLVGRMWRRRRRVWGTGLHVSIECRPGPDPSVSVPRRRRVFCLSSLYSITTFVRPRPSIIGTGCPDAPSGDSPFTGRVVGPPPVSHLLFGLQTRTDRRGQNPVQRHGVKGVDSLLTLVPREECRNCRYVTGSHP